MANANPILSMNEDEFHLMLPAIGDLINWHLGAAVYILLAEVNDVGVASTIALIIAAIFAILVYIVSINAHEKARTTPQSFVELVDDTLGFHCGKIYSGFVMLSIIGNLTVFITTFKDILQHLWKIVFGANKSELMSVFESIASAYMWELKIVGYVSMFLVLVGLVFGSWRQNDSMRKLTSAAIVLYFMGIFVVYFCDIQTSLRQSSKMKEEMKVDYVQVAVSSVLKCYSGTASDANAFSKVFENIKKAVSEINPDAVSRVFEIVNQAIPDVCAAVSEDQVQVAVSSVLKFYDGTASDADSFAVSKIFENINRTVSEIDANAVSRIFEIIIGAIQVGFNAIPKDDHAKVVSSMLQCYNRTTSEVDADTVSKVIESINRTVFEIKPFAVSRVFEKINRTSSEMLNAVLKKSATSPMISEIFDVVSKTASCAFNAIYKPSAINASLGASIHSASSMSLLYTQRAVLNTRSKMLRAGILSIFVSFVFLLGINLAKSKKSSSLERDEGAFTRLDLVLFQVFSVVSFVFSIPLFVDTAAHYALPMLHPAVRASERTRSLCKLVVLIMAFVLVFFDREYDDWGVVDLVSGPVRVLVMIIVPAIVGYVHLVESKQARVKCAAVMLFGIFLMCVTTTRETDQER